MKNISLTSVLAVSVLFVSYLTADAYPRYASWKNLSLQSLRSSAIEYYKDKPVCLYIVDCSYGAARLNLIKNEADMDFENLKTVIWKRRFEGYCKGYTENIVIDTPNMDSNIKKDARWSFFNDRFIENHGRFQGSAASFYSFEECRMENVTWLAGNKQLQPITNALTE